MNTYKKPMLERVWVVCGLAVYVMHSGGRFSKYKDRIQTF